MSENCIAARVKSKNDELTCINPSNSVSANVVAGQVCRIFPLGYRGTYTCFASLYHPHELDREYILGSRLHV